MANNHSVLQRQPIIQMNSALFTSIAEYFGVEATVSAVATALGITTTTLALGLSALGTVALAWSIPRIVDYFSTVETQDTIHTINVDSDSEDEDWTPSGAFRSRRQEIIDGCEERTSLEEEAYEWDESYTRRDVGPGAVSWRMGTGNQMFVQSRTPDYEDESVRVDYDNVAGVLDEGTSEEIEERGQAILQAPLGENVDFSTWSGRLRRAAAHLLGITQVAEEHESRSEGSALLGRGGFQAVADGVSTFMEAFGRAGGQYTPAHAGGTEEMREVVRGEKETDQTLSGLSEGL